MGKSGLFYTVGWKRNSWTAVSTKHYHEPIHDTEIPIPVIYPTDTQVCNICLIIALLGIGKKKENKVNAQKWLNASCCMYTVAYHAAVQI